MHSLLFVAAFLLPAAESLLVSTEWLSAHRSDPDLVLLHVGMEKADYDRGHIAGARYLGLRPPVFDGSMSEWSRRPVLPMVRGTTPR